MVPASITHLEGLVYELISDIACLIENTFHSFSNTMFQKNHFSVISLVPNPLVLTPTQSTTSPNY